jgi:hypothetical protein
MDRSGSNPSARPRHRRRGATDVSDPDHDDPAGGCANSTKIETDAPMTKKNR